MVCDLNHRLQCDGEPRGVSLPQRIFEIIDLEENSDLIYGLQQLTGKILETKSLSSPDSRVVGPEFRFDLGSRFWRPEELSL